MEIQLIALDLDGTLLDSDKQLSSRNEKALRACIEKGIHIVPCTGRMIDGIPETVRNIPGIRYFITANGAVLLDYAKNQIIRQHLLDVDLVLDILTYARTTNAMYDPYIGGRGMMEQRFLDHLDQYGMPQKIQELVRQTRDSIEDCIEYVKENQLPAEKINMFFADLEERKAVKKELEKRADIIVSSSIENNLEINALGATKGEGILHLASYLQIPKEATMGFGDGENDVTMIQMAQTGVVMANGREELKAFADYITASNDEDGVAQAIEKLVL